ncbi:MAG: BtrH N-terminal domain-containing protein, partial [bacterium]
LIFGLCEGLGFQFERHEELASPFVGGTGRRLLQNFCGNLDLQFEILAFDDDDEAEADLLELIDSGVPAIVHVDLFYLPYFGSEMHFSGHRVIPVGYDEVNFYLADTGFPGIQSCPRAALAEARASAYPPYTPRRRRVVLSRPEAKPFVEESITRAVFNNLKKFREQAPGYRLDKLTEFADSLREYQKPRALYVQIEKAGTGGGLCRKLYSQFLDQAFQIYSRGVYEEAGRLFAESAALWRQIAIEARNGRLEEAPQAVQRISELEHRALDVLATFEADDL